MLINKDFYRPQTIITKRTPPYLQWSVGVAASCFENVSLHQELRSYSKWVFVFVLEQKPSDFCFEKKKSLKSLLEQLNFIWG